MELTSDIDVRRAYARDVSGLELVSDFVARAASIDDVVEVVKDARARELQVTPAGSQTSTTGASIVDHGILLSMRGMGRILDIDRAARVARVEPGVTIGALNAELAPLGLRFAPDPTSENDATIGGAIACNASGARSLRYGATRPHVRGVTLVNGDAEVVELRRPRLEKNTVGFHVAQDPVDWIVGSEGTLGIVVQAELALVKMPAREIGLAIPFATERDALRFVVAAREQSDRGASARAQCLEYFDGQALEIARSHIGSPQWMQGAGAIVYLEQAFDDDSSIDAVLDVWLSIGDAFDARADSIDVYDDASALRDARRFRHAVPAFMNERGAARRAYGGRKVSTDWAVPYRSLPEALEAAHRFADTHRIQRPASYGHAGNGHPHQNFIAQDGDDLKRIMAVVDETVHNVLRLGGTVAAEHGLGKLKRHWLSIQLTPMQLAVMRAIKQTLDPRGMFAPGNVVAEEP
ncbi:MAG TPA: FAD-binding oxidoreductase [Gemmatimonadaceae bacterium]